MSDYILRISITKYANEIQKKWMQKYEITKPSVNDKPKRNMKGLINSFESINLLRIIECNLNFYERELLKGSIKPR